MTAVNTSPAVEDSRPPRIVLSVINPVIRTLLRSPLHRPLSTKLMLLSVSGRKSGRTITVPVGRHPADGVLLVSVSGRWRHNLLGGAPVRVTLDGRERTGYAEVERDPRQVALIYKALLDRLGRATAA